MAVYDDMLTNLDNRDDLAKATTFVIAHSEHGVSEITNDPEPACPWDMNSGDLMMRLVSFVCACGKRLDLTQIY